MVRTPPVEYVWLGHIATPLVITSVPHPVMGVPSAEKATVPSVGTPEPGLFDVMVAV